MRVAAEQQVTKARRLLANRLVLAKSFGFQLRVGGRQEPTEAVSYCGPTPALNIRGERVLPGACLPTLAFNLRARRCNRSPDK